MILIIIRVVDRKDYSSSFSWKLSEFAADFIVSDGSLSYKYDKNFQVVPLHWYSNKCQTILYMYFT